MNEKKISKNASGYGAVKITTTITRGLWIEAKEHKINWAEALRRGVRFMINENLNEKNPLQLQMELKDKNMRLARKLEEYIADNEAIQKKLIELRKGRQI